MDLFDFQFKAMGSPCALSFYCESEQQFNQAKDACVEEMARLEAKYSRYQPDSLISKINKAAGSDQLFEIDTETWILMQYATIAHRESDGLFDITSGVLRQIWDFKNSSVPTQEDINRTLDKIGFDKLPMEQNAFRLPITGMELDFGGIVKEYAADVLANFIGEVGIRHGLVDLAGDIAAAGPHPDGRPWEIGISHPAIPGEPVAKIALHSGGLASSGDYARCFVLNDKKYSHILNPITGWPVEGLSGVSVWAEQCIVAGTLATITMLKGEEEGKKWIAETGAPYVTIDQHFRVESQFKG